MNTVIVTFAGKVTPGDLVMLGYRGSKGGQSCVKCAMVERRVETRDQGEHLPPKQVIVEAGADHVDPAIPRAASLPELADRLAGEINAGKEFMAGAFAARTKDGKLIVHCTGMAVDANFFAEVEGARTEKVALETL
jgi:hypothetical protein